MWAISLVIFLHFGLSRPRNILLPGFLGFFQSNLLFGMFIFLINGIQGGVVFGGKLFHPTMLVIGKSNICLRVQSFTSLKANLYQTEILYLVGVLMKHFLEAKLCLTRDTIHRIDIISRCFENKNNNCCETNFCKNAICLLSTNLQIHIWLLCSLDTLTSGWPDHGFVNL